MPESPSYNSKRIVKNSALLYVRTIVTTLIGLYTSRVVLDALGVEDYGIYGLVGGIVSMFGFLNATMSGATSRFITFELGRGDTNRLKKTFSSAMLVHILIAVIIVVISESFGVWWLNNKLVIPEGRMMAANIVLQLSIFSAIIGITQVPYSACIIAHEAMSVYAYMGIIDVILRLGIAFLIQIIPLDRLISYAILILVISVGIRMYYRYYCVRRFPESHFSFCWDKELLRPMLSFSLWDMYGNMCFSFRTQGISFLINIFFGVLYNAASGLASTVTGKLMTLSSDISVAFRPQIIKSYAEGDRERSVSLINRGVKYCSLVFIILGVPLFFKMDFVLDIWLKKVPESAALFCQWSLVVCLFSVISRVLNVGIHATGKIKRLSVVSGTLFLLSLPVIWVGYRMGCTASFAFVVSALFGCIVSIVNASILHAQIHEFSLWNWLISVILPLVGFICISSVFTFFLTIVFKASFWKELIVLVLSVIGNCIIAYSLFLDRTEKQFIWSLLDSFIHTGKRPINF